MILYENGWTGTHDTEENFPNGQDRNPRQLKPGLAPPLLRSNRNPFRFPLFACFCKSCQILGPGHTIGRAPNP